MYTVRHIDEFIYTVQLIQPCHLQTPPKNKPSDATGHLVQVRPDSVRYVILSETDVVFAESTPYITRSQLEELFLAMKRTSSSIQPI